MSIRRSISLAVAVVLVAAACGEDDEAAPATTAPEEAASATVAPTTTEAPAPTTTEAPAPATTDAPATTAAPLAAAGGDSSPEEQAASEAWAVVFDSATPFDAKATHLEAAEELRPTIEAYTGVGSAMGGIRLDPVGVAIDGEQATVTYDVYFGEAPAYTALEGEMALVDGTWTVSRDEFCSFMASARNPCP